MLEDYKFLLLDEDDLDEIEDKIEKNGPKKKTDDGLDYNEDEKDKTEEEEDEDEEEEDEDEEDA